MEEPHDESGKWMLIAHALCCGGPLLLILIASNTALLLSLVHSGAFWAGLAVLLGGVAFFLFRHRWACRVQPPTLRPSSELAPSVSRGQADDSQPLRYPLEAGFHE